MSESNEESGGGGFVSSSTSTLLPEEEQQKERSQDNENAEDRFVYELGPAPNRNDEQTLNEQGVNRKREEVDHESSSAFSRKTTSEGFSKPQDNPRHPYANQPPPPPPPPSSSESEAARSVAQRGRVTANDMDPGRPYSHYPTSDTRTGEAEPIQQHRLGLTGPGFSKTLSGRGRIWETDRYDDSLESRNREKTRDAMSSSASLFTNSKERERKRGGKEDDFSNTNASRRSVLPASAEVAAPVSKIREGGEDYPYSSSFVATSIRRSREDAAVGFFTTKPPPSAAAQNSSSISHAEENSSTFPVPRARNESVSDSSSASAMSHAHNSSQNRYSPDSMSKRPPSPLDAPADYREERRKESSWITADMSSSSTRLPSYSRQDDSPSRLRTLSRDRGTSMIAPPDIEDSSYHHSRSHVSRSPEISYFQNASSKSGTTNTNTVFQGSKTYHSSQQDIFKVTREQHQHSSRLSSEYFRIQSDHSGVPPSSSSSYPSHVRSGPDNIGIERPPLYPPGFGGKDINVGRHLARSKSSVEDSRSHEPRVGRSTSSTPPIPDNRDTLKQRTYVEYQRNVPPPRPDERSAESRKSTQEQERAENAVLDSTPGFSGGLYSVLKGVRAGPSSDVGTNPPPSKATSSYSTPSTTSVSLSPVLSKALPSLRETFASPTISTEPLPPPLPPPSHNLNSTATTSGHQQTVTIPPAQTPSRPIPGGPWLYDGEEPDLEDDDGVNAPDEAGRPKKRRRTRVALSCAECKRRKIKCDRAQPCTPCARRGDQSNCKWAVMETKDGAPTRAEFESLQNRVVRLEQLLSIAPQLKPGH